MSRLNASPHDHWADMGLDDPEPRRVDPGPPEVEPVICGRLEPWDYLPIKMPPQRKVMAFTVDELEFMDAIGE